MSREAVVVEGLTVVTSPAGAAVVRDVSLAVRAGEVLGVVGESGSGKTTLGLSMIGHTRRGLAIDAGTIRVDGTDIRALDHSGLRAMRGRTMAYVPQDPGTALNPSRRIGSQMAEMVRAHGRSRDEARDRIAEVLADVGLDDPARIVRAFPHQLSGGQQQRIAIAMAFACRPRLIVMDEPTTGLDVTTQRKVLETIRDLCASYDVAAIYVSHDLAVVADLADRVAVLYAGELVELGPVDEVLYSPQHPYTRGLLMAVPTVESARRLVAMEGSRPPMGVGRTGCAFVDRCPVSTDRCREVHPDLVGAGSPLHHARCLLTDDAAGREQVSLRPVLGVTTPMELGAEEKPSVLAVGDLRATYGAKAVLHGIDLSIREDECVAVVGESGSGKTTLSRCIVGLHRSWTGEISLGGEALTPGVRNRSRTSLVRLQYIFQNPYASLNPRRSIGNVLMQTLERLSDLDRAARYDRVLETMDAVALPRRLLNSFPDQLSGGERQRVAIARALVVKPKLLICDEVTSSLDVSVQASVVGMLRDSQEQQSLSVLFVTHNLPLVRSIAQRVVVMRAGELVEHGDVAQVIDRPAAPYTRQLLDDLSRFGSSHRLDRVDAVADSSTTTPTDGKAL